MLEGRDDELARFDELLAELRNGRGSGLLLRGEPGIGKTALLTELMCRCDDDVTVLHASGVQTEADLAFAALSDLLVPVLDGLAELPAPQVDALAAALALGPPSPGDRLGVCVATVGLLKIAAETGPVLLVVDDVQWLDAASRECIRFAARRAAGRVAVVLAARDGEYDPGSGDGLPTTRLAPLRRDQACAVLARIAPDLAAPVATALVQAAAGIPLALVELPATLTAGQRAGREPLELPLAAGAGVHDIVTRRTSALGAPARQILRLVAAEGECELARLARASTALPSGIVALDEAESRGLVVVRNGRVRFTHPLIRSVIWRNAASGERRAAHRALGAVSSGEARAWHLAAAAVCPDEEVADELERAAGAAAARRGYASAASALERAAELSPDREEGARRTCAAGEAAAAAGQMSRALDLLDRAAAAADDGVRMRAEHVGGLLRLQCGEAVAAFDVLAGLAERLAVSQPRRAGPALAAAAGTCTVIGRPVDALPFAERAAQALTGDSTPSERADALAVLGWVLVLRGDLDRARRVLDEAERAAEQLDVLDPAAFSVITALNIRLPTGEFERSLRTNSALADRARAAGALGALALPLIIVSDTAYRLGDWARCEDAIAEVVQVVEETGQGLFFFHILAIRARLAAARGPAEEARLAGERALALSEAQQIDSGRCYAHAALGFLELGRAGPSAAAIGHLEAAAAWAERGGMREPTLVPWAPDLVESYLRASDPVQARRVLAVLERQVGRAETAVAHALLARCVGMLVDGYDTAFAEALAWDDRRPMPFERARTHLAYGRRLHRERRRAEARVQLQAALDGFDRLGAVPWTAQAHDELRATGGCRRPRSARDSSALSVQETRVAATAARGGSTRDIAAELFLAPKTVEFHLGQIYRKLGVRNRAQMIVALADAPGGAQPAEPADSR